MELSEFLENSPLSEKIKLEGRVEIHRTRLSQEDILAIRHRGALGPIERKVLICELVVAGQPVAQGKIVKKGGEFYFEVTKMDTKEVRNGK